MKDEKSRIVVGIAAAAFVIAVTFLVWRFCQLLGFPESDEYIPGISVSEKMEIPQRPGTKGIVITGPKLETLWFAIDLRVAATALDWQRLRTIDQHADVKIRARINEGQLKFDRSLGDIKDAGHPSAGDMIGSAMGTWGYTSYKAGEIRFWFHLASTGVKLSIDPSDLKTKKEYERNLVGDGSLYFIKGINPNDAQIENVIF
jgi:hypothetical protein